MASLPKLYRLDYEVKYISEPGMKLQNGLESADFEEGFCLSEMQVLQRIRDSTRAVVNAARHVRISDTAVKELATSLSTQLRDPGNVIWDEEGWHYKDDAATSGPRTAQYIMVLDALNFCFWPTPGLEYEHLAKGLTRVVKSDPAAFDADRLATISETTLASWLPDYELPQLAERARKVREVGIVLQESFGGLAANVAKQSNHSVDKFVQLMTANFPGFRDEAVYQGCQVFFYKRAQILAGDIWGAYGRQTSPHPFGFDDVASLTMFADYRVPQILRARGVLEYSEALARDVDARNELPPGSEEEVEIRAATVQAVELLKAELLGTHHVPHVLSLTLDWHLWQEGERLKDELPPHHRTLTVFY